MSNKNNTEDEMIDNACNELIAHIYVEVENYFDEAIKNGREIETTNFLETFIQNKFSEAIEKTKHNILKIIKEAKQ